MAVPIVVLAAFGAHAELSGDSSSTDTAPSTDSTSTAGQSLDSHAIVVNHGDDRYRYALSLKIVQTGADVVDPQNAAVAVGANCTDCETVAISLEGVLVYGDPTVFAPENLALAYNENCTNCATLAAAYQEEVQNTNRVRITGEGRQRIAAIRVDLQSIRHANLTLAEIDAKVNADAAALLDVLRNDTVPVGRPGTTTGPASTAPSTGTSTTTPSTTSTTPAATPTDTASPSPSDSATASPSPTGS
ncbi:MAG: putative peptide zinc metalloprotease protein [Frankiaceae bacterium]|nr:putative peptide zinc metalloprotease protein [Frankiaceae bacterium]